MKKTIKSIIATALLCVCASGALACGAGTDTSNANDVPNTGVGDIQEPNDNENNSNNSSQMPAVEPARMGIRISDDDDNEIHRTRWEQVKENRWLIEDYDIITLEVNKTYKFQGITLVENNDDWEVDLYRDGILFDVDWSELYETHKCEFDYDKEHIDISQNGCGYSEFYFICKDKGTYDLSFSIIETVTKNGIVVDKYCGTCTYNLHFIFE